MIRTNTSRGQMAYAVFSGMFLFLLLYAGLNLIYSRILLNNEINSPNGQLLTLLLHLGRLLDSCLLVLSAVVFIRWMRRAYYNLRALGIRTYHPDSWVVWAWMIPVVNLHLPYTMMREIWQNTQRLSSGSISPHGMLRVWWVLFLLRSVLNATVGGAAQSSTNPARLPLAFQLSSAALFLNAIAALLTVLIMRRIMQFEQQLLLQQQALALGQSAAPFSSDEETT